MVGHLMMLFPQNICSNLSINNHNNNVSFVITFICAIYICQQVIKIKRFNIWCVFIKFILLFCRSINNKILPIIPDPIMELMKLNEAEDIELVPLFPESLCEDNKQSLSLSIWKDKNSHQEHVQCISDI